MVKARCVLGVIFALGAGPLVAQTNGPSQTGPVINGFGPVFDVPEAGFPIPASRDLKAVFDVAEAPEDPAAVNPRIETVARYLNMHARAGITAPRLKAALVLHGGSGKYALQHDAYRRRFQVDNPNLGLIEALVAAGVQVILCGQTAASRGFHPNEVAPSVELALSAMTALVVLQSDGYALIRF